mmetsp:Transcript_15106/g.35030  ORF Transcript_15106/g.35030 Transcript_15106/m.35030 type:complete len:85 (-) Transcript_15106:1879-2133(-)
MFSLVNVTSMSRMIVRSRFYAIYMDQRRFDHTRSPLWAFSFKTAYRAFISRYLTIVDLTVSQHPLLLSPSFCLRFVSQLDSFDT